MSRTTDHPSTTPLHLAISGDLGSGKSAVAKEVSAALGYSLISTGAIQREIAAELKLSTLETNLLAEKDREIDKRVDSVTKDLGENATEPIVFDSRMAWYMIPRSFKVRLLVSPKIAVSRILGRGSSEVESYSDAVHARREIRWRYESEVRRFLARYGVDVTALKHFDLVVDTSDLTVDEVSEVIIRSYRARSFGKIIASPQRVLPAHSEDMLDNDSPILQAIYSRPFMVAIGGVHHWEAALTEMDRQIEVEVLAEGLEQVSPGVTAADYVRSRVTLDDVMTWASKYGLTGLDSYREWLDDSDTPHDV